ncbi:MAG: ABC transporter permease [candidate division Zixibacteria bacterium]|nr:ABC transporter permease [candidate division Zixibacteria bacterium]
MITGSIFAIAFDALRANKLRSGLTLLGIIIGVTSVMTIISALEGMTDNIAKQFSKLGSSTFVVTRVGIVTSDEMWWEKIKRKPFKVSYVDAIRNGCSDCEKISPTVRTGRRVSYGGKNLRDVEISGTSASHIDIVDLNVQLGRFHSHEDDLHARRVAFIGEDIRTEFFEGLDPIGKELRIAGEKYSVIGVAEKQGSIFGESQDNFVSIPFSAWTKQFGIPKRQFSMTIKASSVEAVPAAMDQVRLILRSERNVPFKDEDDFDLLTAESILSTFNAITAIARMVLIIIPSISLVVGGIVVMNIMMVSVTERTREIGIRKSLGAKQNHILLQFLFESLMLTLGGGIVGIVLGFLIAEALVAMMGMEISPSFIAIMAGLSISGGIGLIFGIYPAMKAARLDPIKALSYE